MPSDGKGREKRRRSESSAPSAAPAVRPKGAGGAAAAKAPKRGKSPDPKRSASAGKATKPRATPAAGKAAGKAKKVVAGKASPSAKDKRKAAAAAAMSAVDDMFEGLAEKKQEKKDADEKAKAYEAAVARLADAREKKLDELEAAARRSNRVRGDDSPEPLRYDEELGMPIYSLEALNIGKGKDTAQCPFDCDCCF